MRVSEKWLREWVDYPGDTTALAQALTMAGLEVDAVEPAAPAFSDVVVGEVIECKPHPADERLSVCRVASIGETAEVVCGAPNARAGVKAPLALPGACLPGGRRIERANLRGVDSAGMLCSARELGLAEDAAGLMALPADAPAGMPLRDYLSLDDQVIELELTPNRGDCLGMAGVAREVGVLARLPVAEPDASAVAAVNTATLPVALDDPAACPRYLGRIVRGVDASAASPLWLRERLRRAGVRPVSVVVDVTNYVMLELGQPMHAFDLESLHAEIRVRWARSGEALTLLNGDTVELDAETLVIADAKAPVALAGIMGGGDSAVGSATRHLFLEAAHFTPAAMAGRARRYGLHSDSSHRFERGVDPALPRRAMERATALLTAIAGGAAGPVIEARDDEHLRRPAPIGLRPQRVNDVLGASIPRQEMRDILERLAMPPTVGAGDSAWRVAVPTWRFDVSREVDLIEEIARVHGYDALPAARAAVPLAMHERPERELPIRRVRHALADRGYYEAITYSFVPETLQRSLDPQEKPIALANPLSAELAVMRTTLWPGLLRAVQYNSNRQIPRVRVFEIGLRFRGGTAQNAEQHAAISGAITGAAEPEQWGAPAREVDFFDLKGDVEALFAMTGEPGAFRFEAAEHPALHPGQSACIYRDERAIGWLGALHPGLAEELDMPARVMLFELRLDAITRARLPAAEALSRYPAIRRDIAVEIDEAVSAQAVRECIEASAGSWLRDTRVFDVYRGRGIQPGRKSLAMGLILQDSYRTLTDAAVEACVERVVSQLRQDLNATLRE